MNNKKQELSRGFQNLEDNKKSSSGDKSNQQTDKKNLEKPEKIEFRDKGTLRRELLGKDAEGWAKYIEQKASYTQLRKFYTAALTLKFRLEQKVNQKLIEKKNNGIEVKDPDKQKIKDDSFKEIEPLIEMLISKANYSKVREKKNTYIFEFIKEFVDKVKSEQDYQDFMLFFEAVLGFYPRKN